jgi:hypothetical protein
LDATLIVWAGRALPSKTWTDCHPCQENSWLSQHRHEGQARPRVLQVWIVEVGAVERAIVGEGGRHPERGDLLAVGKADGIAQPAVIAVSAGDFLRVVHDLVDEVAEVQHERELVLGGGSFVLEDHAPVGVLRPLADVLAADEGEADGPGIVVGRRSPGASDPAAASNLVHEPIPVGAGRLQPGDQNAAGVIGGQEGDRGRRGDHALERRVFGHFHGQRDGRLGAARGGAGPEEDAVRSGIARGDALGEQVAALDPGRARAQGPRSRASPRRPHCGGGDNELPARQASHGAFILDHSSSRIAA